MATIKNYHQWEFKTLLNFLPLLPPALGEGRKYGNR